MASPLAVVVAFHFERALSRAPPLWLLLRRAYRPPHCGNGLVVDHLFMSIRDVFAQLVLEQVWFLLWITPQYRRPRKLRVLLAARCTIRLGDRRLLLSY